jgi:hypothetical protein
LDDSCVAASPRRSTAAAPLEAHRDAFEEGFVRLDTIAAMALGVGKASNDKT